MSKTMCSQKGSSFALPCIHTSLHNYASARGAPPLAHIASIMNIFKLINT